MIAGGVGYVPIMTVKAWMEKLPEHIKGHLPKDILNMEELRQFFKTLPQS